MIKQFIPHGYCLGCRGCCRFAEPDTVWAPALLDEDERRLAAGGKAAACGPRHRIRLVYDRQEDAYLCAFLNRCDNACSVYPIRPFECQLYPFLINRRGKKVFLSIDPKCPCAGQQLSDTPLGAYARRLAASLSTPAFRRLIKRNPQLIQSYADAVDIAELKR